MKFDKLYKNYKRLMFGIAYDILKNEQDAEDAVQEAFIRLADNIEKIADEDSPQARNFSVVVTRNICFNMLRKRHIETDIDDEVVCSDNSACRRRALKRWKGRSRAFPKNIAIYCTLRSTRSLVCARRQSCSTRRRYTPRYCKNIGAESNISALFGGPSAEKSFLVKITLIP